MSCCYVFVLKSCGAKDRKRAEEYHQKKVKQEEDQQKVKLLGAREVTLSTPQHSLDASLT